MRKVLLIVPLSTCNWGDKVSGGVDAVCQMLIKEIEGKKKSSFYYRILAFDPFSEIENPGRLRRLSDNLEIIFFHLNERIKGIKLPGILSQLLRVREQVKNFSPEIVHSHLAPWILFLPNRYFRIVTLHSYKNIGRKSVSAGNDFFYGKLMPFLCDLSIDSYTVVGKIIEDELKRETRKEITVIGNPVDKDYFIREPKVKNKRLVMVTCSVINKKKRIDRSIRLLEFLSSNGVDAVLYIIGPNSDQGYVSDLNEMIENYGLVDRVFFTGRLSKNEIIEIYKKSDVGVFLSEEETFGLVPLEMLASGLPLIATEVGILSENNELIKSKNIRLVEGDNLEQQRDSIGFVRNQSAQYAAELLQRNFSIRSVVAAYEDLYHLCPPGEIETNKEGVDLGR